ncbi:MAG: RNB domain-containing ribonuclease [Thermosynechococcaceae cyanobacterium]
MNQPQFAPQSLKQAEQIVQQPQQWTRPQVQGITIDGPTSRDLDDAIWLEVTEQGAILSVHISDVAEFIPVGSALDHDAIARVNTRYYKTGNSPMLPHLLSESALSLHAGQPRATLTIQLELNPQGKVESCQLFESWLVSRQQFDYAQADAAIAHPDTPWHPLLKSCQDWAQRLNQYRRETGAMGGMKTTGGFYLDESGGLSVGPRYHCQQMIAEFMIAANTQAARWLAEADCLALYRNHTAKTIAPGQDAMLQALLVLGSAAAIRERLQNWLNRAEYSPTLIGHFALNLLAYGHFTSPIRRLADLVNHRVIKAKLHRAEPPYSKLDLENLSVHINQSVIDDKESTHVYYRQKAKATLQTQIESGENFAQLAPKEFSRILKHASTALPPALVEEVKSRLAQGKLQVVDYYLLLIHGDSLALQQLVLDHLAADIHQAASVMSMAQDSWHSMDFDEQQQGDRFLAWAIVNNDGKTETSVAPGQASRKQTARHRACWRWLQSLIQGTLVNPDQREMPVAMGMGAEAQDQDENHQCQRMQELLVQPLIEDKNPIGLLMSICQVMSWPQPIFAFEEWNEGFTCICRLEGLGQVFEGDAIASKKKLAKQQSALQVLTQLKAARQCNA